MEVKAVKFPLVCRVGCCYGRTPPLVSFKIWSAVPLNRCNMWPGKALRDLLLTSVAICERHQRQLNQGPRGINLWANYQMRLRALIPIWSQVGSASKDGAHNTKIEFFWRTICWYISKQCCLNFFLLYLDNSWFRRSNNWTKGRLLIFTTFWNAELLLS